MSAPADSCADSYAVIGNPIHHTKSPQIHGAFAQATRQHMTYRAIEGRVGHFAEDVQRLREAGGKGLNITSPFKLDAFAYATQHSESARMAQAVNALKFVGDAASGEVLAENFDGAGLVRDVIHNLHRPLRGQRILLLGAGGAARGAIAPMLREQPFELVIANRSVEKAQALATQAAGLGAVSTCGYDDLQGERFDMVFNATSASLHGQTLPLPASVFAADALAYELLYGKGLTPFLQLARSAGAAQLADGVGMLVEQAALAFAWWRGIHPPTQAVIEQLTVPLD